MTRALVKNLTQAVAPNLLINGAADFWQRQTTFNTGGPTTSYNTVDRWIVGIRGGSADSTISRSTEVPNSQFKYSIQILSTGVAATNDTIEYGQRIPAAIIKPYIGKTMTASVWVKVTTTNPTAAGFEINTPSSLAEDSWLANDLNEIVEYRSPAPVFVLTVWQRFSFTFVVPATAANGLQIRFDSGSADGALRMNCTGFMLNEGTTAPDHFYRSTGTVAEELLACQRYYEKSYPLESPPATNSAASNTTMVARATNATTTAVVRVEFAARKRTTPVMTFYPSDGSPTGSWTYAGTATAEAVVATNNVSERNFGINFNGTAAGLTTNEAVTIAGHWTADAEL